MNTKTLLAAGLLAILFSCKKNEHPAAPPPAKEPVRYLNLSLTGDFSTSASPLGRKARTAGLNSRAYNDSTLYIVRANEYVLYYKGFFNNPDSIKIPVVGATGTLNIRVTAIRKGSGGGLHYFWQNGAPYFSHPVYSFITNAMEQMSYFNYPGDSIYNALVTDVSDTTGAQSYFYPELEAYFGDTAVNLATVNPAIGINMERTAFGMEFSAANFSGGELTVSHGGLMAPITLTPASIGSAQRIFSSDAFKSASRDSIPVSVSWKKPNGDIVPIGDRYLTFKKNIITKIHITLPGAPGGNRAFFTESAWNSMETINW